MPRGSDVTTVCSTARRSASGSKLRASNVQDHKWVTIASDLVIQGCTGNLQGVGAEGRDGSLAAEAAGHAHRAFHLSLDRGFAGMTIEDVADEAGVSKQTVYAPFGDGENGVKDTLFRAMVEAEVGPASRGPAPTGGHHGRDRRS